MDRPESGGLEIEAAGYYGDSGSSGFIMIEDELHLVGINSHGTGSYWGSWGGFTRVGGYHKEWIDANVASLSRKVPQ